MAKELNEQIKELVEASKKILITTKSKFTGDGLASCLALAGALVQLNKNVEIIIDKFNFGDASKYQFLDGLKAIKSRAEKLKKFIIDLDISQTGIEELSYDVQGDRLKIFLTPKRGVFTNQDLKFETSVFTYDLIFTVGVSELESLSGLYDDHRDLFFQIPVINLDTSPENEQYGHVNLIDLTATSSAEIVYQLLAAIPQIKLSQELATSLLTGMIDATQCFKSASVTPKSLEIVGQLITLGANRQNIINALYQTKTIDTLRLWGKILTNLQSDKQAKLIWSKLALEDLQPGQFNEKEIYGVIDELIVNNPTVKIFLLFYQPALNVTRVIARSLGTHSIYELARNFTPQGDRQEVTFELPKEINLAEKEVIQSLVDQLR